MILDIYPEISSLIKDNHITLNHSTNLFYQTYVYSVRMRFRDYKDIKVTHNLSAKDRKDINSKKFKKIESYLKELSYIDENYDIKLYGSWFSIFTSDKKFVKTLVENLYDIISSISMPKDNIHLEAMKNLEIDTIVRPLWYSQYNYKISFVNDYTRQRYDDISRIKQYVNGCFKERGSSKHITFYTNSEDDIIYTKLSIPNYIKKITKCIQTEQGEQ